jgi:tetratricopeptide (TPR) repeat protein
MPRKTGPTAGTPSAERPLWQRQFRLAPLLVALGLVLAVLIDYGTLFGDDAPFFLVDDDEYVVQNPHVNTGLSGENVWWAFIKSYSSNWHPLTWLSLQLDSELFPVKDEKGNLKSDAACGFHLTNALIHAAAGVLLMWTLTRMTGSFWRSALVAALFTLHPLRVESVAWVSERKDVLGAFFWVLTMLAYDWYVCKPGWGRYAAVAATFALGLMAKPLLVTLPFALLLLDFWPLRRAKSPRDWKKLIVEKLPLVALAAAACVITLRAQLVIAENAAPYYEPKPLGLRFLQAGRAYLAYLGKTIWPAHLAPMYTEPNADFPVGWAVVACGIVLALTVLFLWQARRRPYLAVGWLWYLGTLVPMTGIVILGIHTICDRYTYVPHIGIFLMVVWGLGDWLEERVPFNALSAGAGVLVATCFFMTYAQAQLWRDNVTIFAHAAETSDNNFGAHNLLGAALVREKRFDEAIEHFRRAIAIEPNFPVPHHKLGIELARKQQWSAAAESEEAALRLAPHWAAPKQQLALCYSRLGRWGDAATLLAEVAALDPGRADLHWNLGVALFHAGRFGDADREAREALRLDESFRLAHQLLGLVAAADGRAADALAELRHQPGDVTSVLYTAWALNALGKVDESRELYRKAVAAVPAFVAAERGQAWHMATDRNPNRRSGRVALLKAQVANQATEGRDPSALDALAAAQAEVGEFKAAAATAREALALVATNGPKELQLGLRARLELYERGQPYRE